MEKIILIGTDEIIEINRLLGSHVLNLSNLEFLITQINSKYKDKDFTRQIAKIGAIIWISLIQGHSFIDANKRTATETMQLFFEKNGYYLETSTAGLVYTSLKIANNEMLYENLIDWIQERLKKVRL
jgi:death-on-curing family protein